MLTRQDAVEASPAVGPPRGRAVLACAASLGSVALVLSSAWQWHVLGYVLGAVVLTVAVATFRREDLQRRPSPAYLPSAGLHHTVLAGLVVGLSAALWHAYLIATEFAK